MYQHFFYEPATEQRIKLGKPGDEIIVDGDLPKETKERSTKYMAVSVPAAFTVVDNKTQVTCKNTGEATIIPSVSVNGKEVYRASKPLEPGKTVAAVIEVEKGADKCVTLVESVEGGKFTVTSKLERR